MKTTIYILIITIFIAIGVEVASWTVINFFSATKSNFLFYKKQKKDDKCTNFIFDLHLSQIHNESIECKVENGEIKQGFIYYNHEGTENTEKTFLTLGGSTTDGYFRNPNEKIDGNYYRTWPYRLSEYCGLTKQCRVINGGVGGYSTSHILRKFYRDVLILKNKPDLIILYTGINDYPGQSGPLELLYPYYDKYQIDAILRGKYLSRYRLILFPSTLRVINFVSRKIFDQRIDKNKYFQHEIIKKNLPLYESLPRANFKNKTELFQHNVELLNKFSHALNIDFIIFLEPTMGLQHEKIENYSKNDLIVRSTRSDDYYKMMNLHYLNLRDFCNKKDYCHDISKIIKHDGNDKYVDPRHPNGETHKFISKKIINILKEESKLD